MGKIEDNMRDVCPGVVVRAYQNGRIICDVSVGNTFPYYDLASLTKIIFTTQMMMLAFENKAWNMENLVQDHLPWFPSKTVRVRDLLHHTSGMAWWKPFYKDVNLQSSIPERREQLQGFLASETFANPVKCVYSDLNYLVLGFLLENIYEKNLIEIWREMKDLFYDGTTLEFNVDNVPNFKRSLYAPTEECPFRKKLIQGEVHDENTWVLGGVSTHSGLFGSVDDVSWYALALRSQILGIARYRIRQKTALLFSQRAVAPEMGDFAMGYMMPTKGSSSSGSYLSLNSIGHTGFTGTSVWFDPRQDLSIIILSNRVLYGRDNLRFKELRPKIHDWLFEGLRKSSL